MKHLIDIIIISIASFLAGLLVFFGIKKININESKKYGLFMSTLLIALSLTGCDMFNQNTKAPILQKKPLSKQLELQDIQNTKIEVEKSDRMVELNKIQEWKEFKAFWKKLDSITPAVRKEKDFDYYSDKDKYKYYNTLTFEEAGDLKNQLGDLIKGLREIKDKDISPLEIDLLEKICNERIDYMSFGFSSMVTRMLPPPTLINRENSIKELENKIDTLIELQKRNKIDKEEFQQAITNIKQDIKNFSITDTIYTNYSRFYYGGFYNSEDNNNQDTAEKSVSEFEKHYNDYLKRKNEGQLEESEKDYYKDLEDKYIETQKAIKEVKGILPNFNELIDDLVL